MAFTEIGRLTAFNDIQAEIEAGTGVLAEIRFARRTTDDAIGFTLDDGVTWYWIPPAAGGGDVVGPAGATDDNIATFDTATGKLIQDGGKKISELIADPASPEQGDIIYWTGAAWVRLAHGTAAQFLKSGGHAANPGWDTPAGAGDVVGPAGATGDHLAVFNGATGKLIKDGGAVPAGGGDVYGDVGATDEHLAVFDGDGYHIKDGGAVPAITDFVGARYTTNAGQSIPDITSTIINFEDMVYDTDTAVTVGATWKFTCPTGKGGYYLINTCILFATTNTWAATELVILEIYKGGAAYSTIYREHWQSTTTGYRQAFGSDVVHLDPTEYIDLRVYQGSGGSLALLNNGQYNYVAISKL